jgi:hypothetical protein
MSFIQDAVKAITGGVGGGLADAVVGIAKGLGLVKSADDEIRLRQPLLDFEMKLEEETSKRLETVNATMREEARSDKWPQYLWRPTVGFTFSAILVNNYILLPYFSRWGIVPIVIPEGVWTAMLVVLGAAAASRGWEKVEIAKRNGK